MLSDRQFLEGRKGHESRLLLVSPSHNQLPPLLYIVVTICNNSNQGRGKCYQPKPKTEADSTYLDLDYSRYHKDLIQQLFIILKTKLK